MITNISLASVFVKDVDASKAFYIDVLGFEEHTDLTLGDGYRWCTVKHPSQPELQVHLTQPGPPFTPEMVEAVNRSLDGGGMNGLGMAVDDCRATYGTCGPRASSSCRSRRNARTAWRPSAGTTPGTGWCWSSSGSTPGATSPTPDPSAARRVRGAVRDTGRCG
jgi:hypothetical protein